MMKKILVAIVIIFCAFVGYYTFFVDRVNSWPIINQNPKGESIVAFGDSLTAGTGAAKDSSYPAQLSQMLGQPVINMGIHGETTSEALQRIDTVLDKNPKVVMITLGGNDLKKRVPVNQAFNNLHEIINIFQSHGVLVVIGGLDIPYYGSDYERSYYELAEKTGSLLVPDVLNGIWGDQYLMSDAVHPNADGYKVMAEHFYKVLPKNIKQ